MAAGQVVCPFLDVVFKKLEDLIKMNLGTLWGVGKELNELYSTFCEIKHVLSDAEERQFKEGEELIRLWLQKLNDASYKTDDVLDEFAFKALQLASVGISSNNTVTGAPQATDFRRKVRKDIKKLNKSFHAFAKEASKLDLRRGNIKTTAEEICPGHESISISTEPHVYGRDKDKEKLVEQLLGGYYMTLERFHLPHTHPKALGRQQTLSNSKEDVSTCSILGIGGLGKTTLAQLVYNDLRITKHFEVKSWVCVSNGFDVKRIIKAIIARFPEKAHDSEKTLDSKKACDLEKISDPDDLESLRFRLQKELSGGKRFVLVLDDVWDISQQEWKKLKEVLLKCGAKASSIIVTTRLQTTASITAGKEHTHHLEGLLERDCLALFEQYAFGMGNEEIPALVKIGKEIVKKCGGLPLTAKAMGGMLLFKKEESEWNEVKESEVWELAQSSENNILPSLRLSYYHLPPTLKRCFVYCSIFPKGYLIEKQQLIQLWIANGLVQSRAKIELEDVGNEIFNGLLQRSFFQDEKENEVGDIISCKMHDLVHDLAIYIAGDEYVGKDDGSTRDITERTRHVSVMSNGELPPSSILGSIERSSSCLRSLLLLNDKNVALVSELALSNFICLRALDLQSSGIEVLSGSIGEMIHLRYLNLSRNWDMTSIPESICSLRNLQTLNLRNCKHLKSLPKDMGKMTSLRHLDIRECISLQSMPIGMGRLTRLCTLSKFIVGKVSGNGVDELQGLNNLRGELEIRGLEKVKNRTEAKVANLMNKKHLHSLGLMFWSYSGSDSKQDQQGNEIQEEIIEGLQPHENLRKLKVKGYGGVSCSPSWLTAVGVPNLVEITLENCTRCEHLPPLGNLRYLKVLKLHKMGSLKFIDVDANVGGGGGFPSLEEIHFSSMHNLKGWSSSLSSLSLSSQATQVAVFPSLKFVNLFECPKLTGGIPLACSRVQSVDMFDCNGMFLGSLRDLPCLPYLQIKHFDELECFPPGALRNLTALETLVIEFCDNLKSLPVELKSLAKLTALQIYKCSNLVSLVEGGLKNLSSLKTLEIFYCKALKRLPELEKTSLVNLTIKGCGEMNFLKEDFEQLVALETLKLSDLPKLTCLPEGIKDSAATLKRLEIGGYEEDNDAMDLPDWIGTCLIKLEYLHINAPKNWKVLPLWMQHLAALKKLRVFGCNDAMDLPDWIGTCLIKLEYLEINAPKNWKVLPLWMQHLAALKQLRVCGCNKELKKRWKRWKEKTHFGSEEDDEEDEEYNEDDEEDEEDDEDDEEDEEYNEDNKEDEDKEREDYCFNMISHVPDVKLSSYIRAPDWSEDEYDSS